MSPNKNCVLAGVSKHENCPKNSGCDHRPDTPYVDGNMRYHKSQCLQNLRPSLSALINHDLMCIHLYLNKGEKLQSATFTGIIYSVVETGTCYSSDMC